MGKRVSGTDDLLAAGEGHGDDGLDQLIEGLPGLVGDERAPNALQNTALLLLRKTQRKLEEAFEGVEVGSKEYTQLLNAQIAVANQLHRMGVMMVKGKEKSGNNEESWGRRLGPKVR